LIFAIEIQVIKDTSHILVAHYNHVPPWLEHHQDKTTVGISIHTGHTEAKYRTRRHCGGYAKDDTRMAKSPSNVPIIAQGIAA
jgi:hypothetical protein